MSEYPQRSRGTARLTERAVQGLIRSAKPGKYSDGGGLYLFLSESRTASWRYKYRILDGCGVRQERTFSIGTYPQVGIAEARAEHLRARQLVAAGTDPVIERRVRRAEAGVQTGHTFAEVAAEWLKKQRPDWTEDYFTKSSRALERDMYPALGNLPIASISPPMVVDAVDRIVERGARETASRILQHVAGVFRLAQARGYCRDNPATPATEVLPRRRTTGRRPAVLEAGELREILRRTDVASLSRSVALAHRVIAYTAQRIGNVVEARWEQFDLDAPVPTWTIPRASMKIRTRQHDHRVVLAPTIAAELRRWSHDSGRTEGFVFPSPTGRAHITRESLEKVYRVTLGLQGRHSLHGWRSSFSTLARDAGFPRDAVELTLDHVHDNATARAYDRGERLDERVRLMAWWDEQLATPADDPKIIPLRVTG